MKVVCIDDDLEDLEIFEDAIRLIKPELICMMATNGKEGLSLLHASRPQMLFLDINMPEIDGRMVLRTIRRDRSFDDLRICILSTSMTPAEAETYKEMGANYCMRKPNSFDDFKASLKLLLEDTGRTRPDEDTSPEC